MAPRLLPASALSSVSALAEAVDRQLADLSHVAVCRELRGALAEARRYAVERSVLVDLAVSADGNHLPELERLLGTQGVAMASLETPRALALRSPDGSGVVDVSLTVFGLDQPPIRAAGTAEAAVIGVVLPAPGPDDHGDLAERLAPVCAERAVAVLIGGDEHSWPGTDRDGAIGAWVVNRLPAASFAGGDLVRLLATPSWNAPADLLRAACVLRAVERTLEAARDAIQRELRGLRARLALIQSKSPKTGPGQAAPMEAVSEARTLVARATSELEREASDELRLLFAPQSGQITQRVEYEIQHLDRLDAEKRLNSVVHTVPEAYVANLFGLVRAEVMSRLFGSWRRMAERFDRLERDGEALLEGEPVGVEASFRYPAEQRYQRVMDSSLRIDRPYRNEVPRRTLLTALVRRGPTQALLTWALGVGGFTGLFSRQNPVLKILAVLVAAGSLVTGIRRYPREKAETFENEVQRARDALRAELRRSLGELEREIGSLQAEHLRAEAARASQRLETAVRDRATRRMQDRTDESRNAERRAQGIDQQERQFTAALKGLESSSNSATQLRDDLRQLITTAAAGRQPATP